MADTGVTQLQKTDTKVGDGAEARPGRVVRRALHRAGCTTRAGRDKRGQKFDSSKDSKQPFDFTLGGKEVIPGMGRGRGRHEGRRHARAHDSARDGVRCAAAPAAVIPPNATRTILAVK